MADAENPLIAKVLARFPDVLPGSLQFPAEAVDWTEKEVELFVGSGGFLKPKRKPASKASPAATPPATGSSPPPAVSAAAPAPAAPAPAAAAGISNSSKKPEEPPQPTAEPASTGDASPTTEGTAAAPAVVASVTHPSQAAAPAELEHTWWHNGEFWAPYASYMEDVGERGLRISAALNKCERFRNIGLMKGADFTLDVLKRDFKAGILLREFALEMTAEPPQEIMSMLWISLRLELPCAPFMPMFQTVVPDGSQTPVCRGAFGMLMLNTETMSVLSDNKIYEKVAVPLRKAFGIAKPTGQEGVPKFPRLYPPRGAPFTPVKLLRSTYTVMPSDCDMYRVIFHPQIVAICEKVNFALGTEFREEPAVAVYANLAKPVGVGGSFSVAAFVQPAPSGGTGGGSKQTRVLYLFSEAKSARGQCAMAAFLVFGRPPGSLYSEDISACAATKFGVLEAFAATGTAPAADKTIDLSRCTRT